MMEESVSMVNSVVIEILENGKEIFEKNGGSIGEFINKKGQFCAWGAFLEATKQCGCLIENDKARQFLVRAADILYFENVAEINDRIGQQAVLHVYDYAIKLAKENK